MKREPFTRHQGVAAPIMADNIDTDQIIPSREMKAVSREGLGEGLFAGWRYLEPGGREPNPDFVFNQPAYENATILIGGANFGCGSSREHAVWALKEFGIKAIIAKSFGEIFHGNCARNGILPVTLDGETVEKIAATVAADPQSRQIVVDLENQAVSVAGEDITVTFDVDAYQKKMLIGGLDPIGLTLTKSAEIDGFLSEDKKRRPWVYAQDVNSI